jgi:hypothetical protein
MCKSRFDLSVGESIQIDDQILTVIDIHGDEITFRLDRADESDSESASPHSEKRRPR